MKKSNSKLTLILFLLLFIFPFAFAGYMEINFALRNLKRKELGQLSIKTVSKKYEQTRTEAIMLKEAIEFAENNDLHFTYNQEQRYFYFDKDGKLSDHVKIGDENKFNQVKTKMVR